MNAPPDEALGSWTAANALSCRSRPGAESSAAPPLLMIVLLSGCIHTQVAVSAQRDLHGALCTILVDYVVHCCLIWQDDLLTNASAYNDISACQIRARNQRSVSSLGPATKGRRVVRSRNAHRQRILRERPRIPEHFPDVSGRVAGRHAGSVDARRRRCVRERHRAAVVAGPAPGRRDGGHPERVNQASCGGSGPLDWHVITIQGDPIL